MTAAKHSMHSKAGQYAAQLGVGAFAKAAKNTAESLPPLVVPTSLPPTNFPCPDNIMVTDNQGTIRISLQTDGLIFKFVSTPGRKFFALERVTDKKGTLTNREMNRQEAEYGLDVIERKLSPFELTTLKPKLDELRAALPGTPYPDKPIKYDENKREYTFTRYGYEFKISRVAPYPATVAFRDGYGSSHSSRPMQAGELLTARRAISCSMNLNDSVSLKPFLEVLENRQYDLATPAPKA